MDAYPLEPDESKPTTVERNGLTKRQKRWLGVGVSMLLSFMAGTMVSDPTPKSAETESSAPTGTAPKSNERGDNNWLLNQYLAQDVIKSRLLAHGELSYFLGHVEIISGDGQVMAKIGNPIVMNDTDVFFPGRSGKLYPDPNRQPGDFDYKVYAVASVHPGPEEGMGGPDIWVDFLDDLPDVQFKFFDIDGKPVEMPDTLLPQYPSDFVDHTVFAKDLEIAPAHDGDGSFYIHAPDGTHISYQMSIK